MSLFQSQKKEPARSKAVVVLGSGRSGTSVLARVINILGVDLGENFIRKNSTNPKGFYEDKMVVESHIKMERMLEVRPYPENFQSLPEIRPYREALKDYVDVNFADKPIWGWKDPRNNDFLPMWKDILSELNVEGYYLIIIRNPIDVIRSYKRAYNRDETWARLQWQYRTLVSLKETDREKRIIVEYDQLFNNSLRTARRIAQTFGFPWPEDESQIKAQLDEFIDPNLQTSKSDTAIEEFKKRQDIQEDVKELYLHCIEGARAPGYLETRLFQQKVNKMYKDFLKEYGQLRVLPPKTPKQ